MSTREIEQVSPTDKLKWLSVTILFAGGMAANYHYAALPLAYRLIGWFVLAFIMGFVLLQTARGRAFWSFANDARTEMRKVVWPTRQETVQTTMIVVVMVVVVALFLWGIDSILLWAVGLLTGQRG